MYSIYHNQFSLGPLNTTIRGASLSNGDVVRQLGEKGFAQHGEFVDDFVQDWSPEILEILQLRLCSIRHHLFN